MIREKLNYVVSRNTAISTAAVWLGVAAAVVVVAVPWLPYFGTPAFMHWAVEVMCYLILAQMWNLLAGYAGLMSVGMQAFVGAGGYSVFIFAQHLGINPFLSIPIASAAAAAAAALTSPLVFRMRAGNFAIGTWVLAEVFRIGFSNVSALGGGSGQSLTVMTRIDRGTREIAIYLIAAATLIVASLAINLLLRSRFGLGLTALRDRDAAAENQGVDVRALKLQVYTLASFGAGLVEPFTTPPSSAYLPRPPYPHSNDTAHGPMGRVARAGGNPRRLPSALPRSPAQSASPSPSQGRFNARGREAKIAASFPRGSGWSFDRQSGARVRPRRVTVKVRIVKANGKAGGVQAHLRYLEREGVSREGEPGRLYSTFAGRDVRQALVRRQQ